MLRQLRVSNYRSLGRDVAMRFGRISIFIGPNGSGKSNALDALSFVRDAVLQGLPAAITHREGIDSIRRHSSGHPYNMSISLEVALKGGPATYGFEITGDRTEEYRVKSESASVKTNNQRHRFRREGSEWHGPDGYSPRLDDEALELTALAGDTRFKPLADFLGRACVYSIFPDVLRVPQTFDSASPMKRHGENWVSILRELLKTVEKADLLSGLGKLTGDIEDARVVSAAGFLVAEFKQIVPRDRNKRKKWFAAGRQSDGTLRVAGLLTALLQKPTIPVIGIEEPELTVHPGALPMIYEYLVQASEVSQVIITTHSPIILDVADVERDRIFVVERSNGYTDVRCMSEEQLAPVHQKLLSLGDLYLSGERPGSRPCPVTTERHARRTRQGERTTDGRETAA